MRMRCGWVSAGAVGVWAPLPGAHYPVQAQAPPAGSKGGLLQTPCTRCTLALSRLPCCLAAPDPALHRPHAKHVFGAPHLN